MAHIKLIYGGPGTGKTHALLEELEETLTAAVTDINTRMAENTALAELAEQVRLLTERVKALEDAAQTT